MTVAPLVVALGRHIGRPTAAHDDDPLQPIDHCVLVAAVQLLDTVEFRPLKLTMLQQDLERFSLPTLSRSVRRLVREGYLIRSSKPLDGREFSYLIPAAPLRRVPSP